MKLITYDHILSIAPTYFKVTKKSHYFLLIFKKYHVSIFKDQWENYETITKHPYYLFHISTNSDLNKCSTYFWIDKKTLQIKNIPSDIFKYNQPNYGLTSSTRSSCNIKHITKIIKKFQSFLNQLNI